MKRKLCNNFSEWYNDIIERAEVLDIRYPVKGLYVWFPYGFKIRKHVVELLSGIFDGHSHRQALFPLLIPEDEFSKEAKHIKGFEGEVYWVTHGGREPLNVKLALRPTSETAIYPMLAIWIRSHQDMPLKVYQVVNTFRYETKHTRPLIRLREITTFVEAHTAHASYEDAERQVGEAIEMYKKFFDSLGIPYSISKRPDWDKFPGADYTIAFDTIFPDGRTLQIATVHNLGQTFAKTFDIKFENIRGEQEYAYQTCYGISDRVIASTLAVHGDDAGLCLPPAVAPVQCVIIPIWFKGSVEQISSEVRKLEKALSGIRTHIDERDVRPGSKFFDWEIKGIPLRLELGPEDIKKRRVIAVRRDTGEKRQIPRKNLKRAVAKLLDEISKALYEAAWSEFKDRIRDASSMEDAKKKAEKGGIIKVAWCGEKKCADEVEAHINTSVLGIGMGEKTTERCVACGNSSKHVLLLGKAY